MSYYGVVLASPSLITTTEIAKDYGLSAKKLNQILREEQVQFHQSGRWFLYAKFAEKGYTQSKTYEYDEGKTCTHMYRTQKGRLFIYDLLKNIRGLLPVVEREGEDARSPTKPGWSRWPGSVSLISRRWMPEGSSTEPQTGPRQAGVHKARSRS